MQPVYAQSFILVAFGKERVAQWNAREGQIKRTYTGGQEFTPTAPEQPCLDAESLFAHLGWLGDQPPAKIRPLLPTLANAAQPMLAEFARARVD